MGNDEHEHEIAGMYEVLDALEAAIASAEPAKREALAKAIDGYHDDFPEDFHWALSAQSPVLLYHLFMSIDTACRPDAKTKGRVLRLVDRKPEGNT
jgi:hypothetical protein